MAQVAFEKNIGSEWVDVTTLATLTEDEVYYIQNRGAGVLIAQENNAEPTDEAGTVVMPYKVLKYTNNGKCWVKSLSGLCAINITDKNASPMPALWFEFMQDLTDDLGTPRTLTKEIDGYDVTVVADEEFTFEPTVEKDGVSAGTASVYFWICDENGEIVFKKEASEVTIEATSSDGFDLTFTDGNDVYSDSISLENDPETGLSLFISSGLTKNGEPFGQTSIYVKCEQGE